MSHASKCSNQSFFTRCRARAVPPLIFLPMLPFAQNRTLLPSYEKRDEKPKKNNTVTHNTATATHSPPHETLPAPHARCARRCPARPLPIVRFQPPRRLLASLPTSAIHLEQVVSTSRQLTSRLPDSCLTRVLLLCHGENRTLSQLMELGTAIRADPLQRVVGLAQHLAQPRMLEPRVLLFNEGPEGAE